MERFIIGAPDEAQLASFAERKLGELLRGRTIEAVRQTGACRNQGDDERPVSRLAVSAIELELDDGSRIELATGPHGLAFSARPTVADITPSS